MKITVYAIGKKENDCYEMIVQDFSKLIARYASIRSIEIFNKKIASAQALGEREARHSYTEALSNFLEGSFSVALDPGSKEYDSLAFSQLLKDRASVSFFIGGAFGFEEEFLNKCTQRVSLGKLTMSHKIAKVVLMEQIYRGLAILAGHPYHK